MQNADCGLEIGELEIEDWRLGMSAGNERL
jgi:hypothetical protein